MTPKISIVVPVYNLELYVERCLESLVSQTLQEIEIIVVDDGSTDDSQVIIREYAERYPSLIRSCTKTNGGHGSACNFGIDRARGDYVMIVDGDDFLDPDTCEFMDAKARETGADMLVGNLRYIFSDRTECYQPIPLEGEAMLDDAAWSMLFLNWATPCGRMYKRSLFEDPKLRFLPGIIFADVNFSPKTYAMAERIYYVNRELYNYDVTRPTQSLKQTDKRVLNVVPALRDILDFYREKGLFEDCRFELMQYTVRHCVGWLEKIKTLHGYPRLQALRELFAVLDDAFEDDWIKAGVLSEVAGRRRGYLLRAARRLGYTPVLWSWAIPRVREAVDTHAERVLLLPLRGYKKLRSVMDRVVLDRLSV